jgi:hypothetical protein
MVMALGGRGESRALIGVGASSPCLVISAPNRELGEGEPGYLYATKASFAE